MEKYVRLQDINDLLMRMAKEPRYQHEEEDYYSGVAQVAGELVGIDTIEFDGPKQGEWVAKAVMIRTPSALNYTCSVCGAEGHCTPYCPNCGAKMIYKKEAD
jgi:predicted RNA-binding Zn-ribbon protein involved in translation (DUF1610 family)